MAGPIGADGRPLRQFSEVLADANALVEKQGGTVFVCTDCQLVMVTTGMAYAAGTGGVRIQSLSYSVPCEKCRRPLQAYSPTVATVDEAGTSMAYHAVSVAHAVKVEASVSALMKLHADATVEEIVAALEAEGLHPLAEYLRAHHLELSALGISLVSIVVALLTWLYPRSAEDPSPPPPPGITYDQMERLVQEVQESTSPSRANDRDADQHRQHHEGRHGEHGHDVSATGREGREE